MTKLPNKTRKIVELAFTSTTKAQKLVQPECLTQEMFVGALADNPLTLQRADYGNRLNKEMAALRTSLMKMIRNGEQEQDHAILNKERVVHVRWLILKANVEQIGASYAAMELS
jgi:hypothetical protein